MIYIIFSPGTCLSDYYNFFLLSYFLPFQLGKLFQMLEGLDTKIEKDGLLDKYRKPELNSKFMEEWSCMTKKFVNALPYSLTPSQLSATSEIIWDLKRPVPMNRLLQVLYFFFLVLYFITYFHLC